MIIGFGFTKIVGEKRGGVKGKINITNNVGVTDVKEISMAMAKDKKSLKITFNFESKYEPNIGGIILEGEIISLLENKKGDEILKGWKKDKRLPSEFIAGIINHVLDRCNIQSLIMCRDLNLPAPIPLPKVNIKKPEGKADKKRK